MRERVLKILLCLAFLVSSGCAHMHAHKPRNKSKSTKVSSVPTPKRTGARATKKAANANAQSAAGNPKTPSLDEIAKYNAKFDSANGSKNISLKWPLTGGVILKNFNASSDKLHEGLTIGAPLNTQVKAAAEGTVLYAGDDNTFFGNVVIIGHVAPFITVYAHLNEIKVAQGAKVSEGAVIGTVGNNPQYQSPALFFQVRKNRTPDNPELYLTSARG